MSFGRVTSVTTVASVFGLETSYEPMQLTTTEMGGHSDDRGARSAVRGLSGKRLMEPMR